MSESLVLARISKLPALPLVAQKLLVLMQRDDCSADDVTGVLSTDQALASRVLKLANSPFYGMSGKISTVSRAVVILGFSAIRNMALGLGVANAISKCADATTLSGFWNHAITTAAAARTIARECKFRDPEELFIAGLLHDLGRLILETIMPGYELRIGSLPPDEFLKAEAELVGLAHTKVGQKVARHWNLPERLGDVLRFHHHPTHWRNDETGLLAGVILGDLLARSLGESSELPVDPPDPVNLAGHLGLSLVETETIINRTFDEVDNTRAFLEIAGVSVLDQATSRPAQQEDAKPQGTVAFFGNDPERAGWTLGQLVRLGWKRHAASAALGDQYATIDVAILDPRSLKQEQVRKLATVLSNRGIELVLACPAPELAELLPDATALQPAIVSSDLATLLRRIRPSS